MSRSTFLVLLGFTALAASPAHTGDRFAFDRRVLDAKVGIGYGVAIEDLDGDAKLDILLADAREFVWYRNPEFTRTHLHDALAERDNVAIAARRFAAGSWPHLGLGGDWNPADTTREGCARYFSFAGADRSNSIAIGLDAEPTVHRMRFVDLTGSFAPGARTGTKDWALVVAPLHGRGSVDGQGPPVKVFAYVPGEEFGSGFTKEPVDASLRKTHNLDVGQWDPDTTQEEIVLIGEEGARLCSRDSGAWTSRALEGVSGGGEIRMGRRADGTRILATIEPMHGGLLALYTERRDGSFDRRVLDDTLNQGHALAIADLDSDGDPEVICGWREKDAHGETGIRVYPLDAGATPYRLDSAIACEDLQVADLNGDGRPEVVAAGRASRDLLLFENRTQPRGSAAVASDEAVEFEGARVSYRRWRGADPSRPPLVFVHGWSCDRTVWDVPLTRNDLPEHVGARTRVAIDLPGHGESAMPTETPTFAAYARAIAAVLERERAERAVLVGHSNGAPIVRLFSRLFPERVEALVLVDGPLKQFVPDGDATRAMAARFVGPGSDAVAAGMIEGTVSKTLQSALRADLVAMMNRVSGVTRRDSFLASLDAEVWKPDPITCPLLMLQAKQPSWSPEYVAFVEELAPHVEYVEWDGVSHFLMCERPAEFLAALDAFLARL